MSNPETPNAVNPLPPVVVALFFAIVLIEAAFSLGQSDLIGGPRSVGWRSQAIQDYAWGSAYWRYMLETASYPVEVLSRMVSYMFLHWNLTHAAFASVMVLALGKFVGDIFPGWAVLAVFFVSGIAGAVAYGVLQQGNVPLIGAYPGVYGLIGAFTYLNLMMARALGERQIMAFRLIGFLLAIQLLFGALFGGQHDWMADLAGFITGFGLSFFVAPGGWAAIRARLRHD